VMTRLILVVMATLASTAGAVLSCLVHSCGGVGVADLKEPDMEEPCSRLGLAGSSGELKQGLHW
jgi:hypothetical protein